MKLKCKLCDFEVVVEDALKGSAALIQHVQKKHVSKGMEAMFALGGYVSAQFFEPVATEPLEPMEDMYKETKRAMLVGFREWCAGNIHK